ncbi:MAG: hypothetical protein U1E06_11570 [Tabrizicola sp.]|uniref:hypothetical protein n=1 Tax=Tabrizicola sp. TaxID=2005166 RepID=UPI002732FB4E|nr:hypothetical protein [Tabrizicola sp.]MDP3261402.1 hypothetical protein [Tabrizicola sp.]MDP3649191.1 hypothetical protein [Paracoccaceae bacterium]MDZ4067464.1 hypothetical protein [Tabrizicola sp.]
MVHLAHIRTDFGLSNGTYGCPRCTGTSSMRAMRTASHGGLMREDHLTTLQKRRFKRTKDNEHA